MPNGGLNTGGTTTEAREESGAATRDRGAAAAGVGASATDPVWEGPGGTGGRALVVAVETSVGSPATEPGTRIAESV
ncbi:MAG: hypothetical protein FWD17_05060, partial [Polyangiaceae bacterium]|nr:hypothetical protein [Polyangiaceae bacterium]